MTSYMFVVPRLLGIPQMDIGITIGRLCDPSDSYGLAYWTGWTLWHVVNAVIYVVPFGLVVWIVRQITTRLFGVWWQVDVFNGFLFGLVLLLLGPMTGVPSMLADLPQVTERGLTNPGFFMLDLHLGLLPALVDLGAHSFHGCLVGWFYKLRVSSIDIVERSKPLIERSALAGACLRIAETKAPAKAGTPTVVARH